MVNAIFEVALNKDVRGNVVVKVYNPSVSKKKGATIELRKMSGFNYENVKHLKTMITKILDGLIAGLDIDEVLKSVSENGSKKRSLGIVTSKPKLFTCDLCNFQTRFGSALKAHKTCMHNLQWLQNLNQALIQKGN